MSAPYATIHECNLGKKRIHALEETGTANSTTLWIYDEDSMSLPKSSLRADAPEFLYGGTHHTNRFSALPSHQQIPTPLGFKNLKENEQHDYNNASESLTKRYIYQVHFKRSHRNCVYKGGIDIIEPGDFVKVEGDRGEDLGIVAAKVPIEDFQEVPPTAGYRGRGFCSGQQARKLILRHATERERYMLLEKVVDEEIALQTIRTKVLSKHLRMQVLDCEYQFDRHKLVFYFEAQQRIDFRELVSELFSQFKTRIWMQQVDTSCLPQLEIRTKIALHAGLLLDSYSSTQITTALAGREVEYCLPNKIFRITPELNTGILGEIENPIESQVLSAEFFSLEATEPKNSKFGNPLTNHNLRRCRKIPSHSFDEATYSWKSFEQSYL